MSGQSNFSGACKLVSPGQCGIPETTASSSFSEAGLAKEEGEIGEGDAVLWQATHNATNMATGITKCLTEFISGSL